VRIIDRIGQAIPSSAMSPKRTTSGTQSRLVSGQKTPADSWRKVRSAAEDGTIVPGEAIECRNTGAAILRAEILSRIQGNIGAIAFSRTGDPDVGRFEDAVVLKRFDDVPSDITMLF